jgi:hypothetical protein
MLPLAAIQVGDLIPIIAIVCVFTFVGVIVSLGIFTEARRKERDQLFRHELLKKLAETPAGSAEPVFALLREEDARKQRRVRDGVTLGGLICAGVGVGIVVLLSRMHEGGENVWPAGLIPLFVGLAMILHARLVLARPKS